jgi:hypothetical protein
MAKYGKKAQQEVEEEMHKLKTGESSAKSREQAVAIGLDKARRAKAKVPSPNKKQ